jgi:nicotinate-nucleotide pyrophosphorylase (carboxylating)
MRGPVDVNAVPLARAWAELSAGGLARRLVELARDEDLGPHGADVTAIVSADDAGGADLVEARVRAREGGVIAGLACVPLVLEVFGVADRVRWTPLVQDGAAIDPGAGGARRGADLGVLTGPRSDIVMVERTVLNLVGRLSGVATRTARFVRLVEGTGAAVYDTRKTTPGLRVLEKYAVRCGGGRCHRLGLHDAVLMKDNHVAGLDLDGFESRVRRACDRAAAQRGHLRFVMIEVDGLDQLARVIGIAAEEAGALDVVLLDNFGLGELREAVSMRARAGVGVAFEASGGVNEGTIGAIAQTGVERISVGGLTHHAVSLDIGLDIAWGADARAANAGDASRT